MPQESLKNYLALLAENVAANNLSIAKGQPLDFSDNTLIALNALKELEYGKASFDGENWLLSGKAKTYEGAQKLKSDLTGWNINITSPPKPVASKDYRFVATKLADGTIGLIGDVPTKETANYIGILAGKVATDKLNILSPAPDDFKRNLFNGIRALKMLQHGQLSFRAQQWYLNGIADNKKVRDDIIAIINELKRDEWNLNIKIEKPEISLCRKDIEEFAKNNAILFDVGKAIIKPESEPIIERLALLMNNCKDADIHVQGHTDSDGSFARNMTLSVDRAEAVVNALIEKGVDQKRLFAIGYGESMPIATNETIEGKRQNRRTVFSIIGQ